MEIIYSDVLLPDESVEKCLTKLFPELTWFNWDANSEPPNNMDFSNPKHVFFDVSLNTDIIEFGCQLSIYRTPEFNIHEREVFIVRDLLTTISTRFLITYSDPEDPTYPYHSIIFDKNMVFLADDSNTNFADGETDKVRIVKQIELKNDRFHSDANMVI